MLTLGRWASKQIGIQYPSVRNLGFLLPLVRQCRGVSFFRIDEAPATPNDPLGLLFIELERTILRGSWVSKGCSLRWEESAECVM